MLYEYKEDTFKSEMSSQKSEDQQQQQSTSVSNLLEINNYLRREKDQLDESNKSLSLKLEISQQKQKALESEGELHRKSVQVYERQIEQLKQKLEQSGVSGNNVSERSIDLVLDENKRFRDEIESLTADNTKLGEEVRRLEDEIGNLKASLNMSELKFESLSGSSDCLKVRNIIPILCIKCNLKKCITT